MAQQSEASSQRVQDDSILECPICLQSCVHPVELPCSHIFCYLCIKGVVLQGPSGRCAICRQSIPQNVLTHPRLKDISQLYKDQDQGSYQWYYEARGGGWWMYDVRTMQELERAYEAKQATCQVLIAGQMYEIDFSQMIQYRVNNRSLFRRIKRDYSTAEKRGVAGIRLNQISSGGNSGSGGQSSRNASGQGGPPTSSSRRRGSPQVTADNHRGSGGNQLQEDATENAGCNDSDENEDEESCSENEDVDDDEDDDDDMDLGEEEEDADDSGSDCADECRDGARAPTRRSDRSNSSSNNQTSPPSTPSGSSGSANNCAGSPVDNKKACVRETAASPEQHNVEWAKPSPSPRPPSERKHEDPVSCGGGGGRTTRSRSRQSATPSPSNNGANVQIGSIHLNSPINNNGSLTCILIGPSLRITIDYNGAASPDEVL